MRMSEFLDDMPGLRAIVRSAPEPRREELRIRIRFAPSPACKKEYERWRRQFLHACVEVGFCPPVRFYKPKKCIVFWAEAVTRGAHGEESFPVGYLLMITDSRWRGFIYDAYVARPWRGMGIGTALVRAAVMLVKEKRGPKVKAIVLEPEVAARLKAYGIDYDPRACRRILEKNGFREKEAGLYEISITELLKKEAEEKTGARLGSAGLNDDMNGVADLDAGSVAVEAEPPGDT